MAIRGIIFLIIFQTAINASAEKPPSRQRRFLIFPPRKPCRVQFIGGVGIPVDLYEISVVSGYVVRAEYELPASIQQLKPAYLDLEARETKNKRSVDANATFFYDPITRMNVERYDVESIDVDTEPLEVDEIYSNYDDDDDTWRNKKYNNDDDSHAQNSRWNIYQMIEELANDKGYSGRSCVLRSICEAAEVKFTVKSGIFGELLHTILTPSTTTEKLSENMDEEYLLAEQNGSSGKGCDVIYSECNSSLLNIFSDVHDPFHNDLIK